jgi:hypothetical protein
MGYSRANWGSKAFFVSGWQEWIYSLRGAPLVGKFLSSFEFALPKTRQDLKPVRMNF